MIDTFEHGPIRELRLNRPPVNALSPELIVKLKHLVEAAAREGFRALVVSGTPGRFSGGLDVPLLLTLDRSAMADLWRNLYGLMGALAGSPIPIAAAITGHAPAGGTVLSLFCDWRVMAEGEWKLGLNEVQVGLTLPRVIFRALEMVVGHRQAERLATTGMLIAPAEAVRIGLIDETAPAERVVERAIEWCQALLAVPWRAMLETRARARADLVALFRQDLNYELNEIMEMWWSAETQGVLRTVVEQMHKRRQSAGS